MGGTDCAQAERTSFSGFQLQSAFQRVRRKSRGNKDGVPVGCAVTETGGAAFSSLAARLPGGRRRGARARPSLSNLSAPAGAAPTPPPCPGPSRPRSPLCAHGLDPCHCRVNPELCAEFRPAGAYLGHWPAPGRRQKPAAACTPPPPPRAPSPRPSGAPASLFLPREVGARSPQHRRHLCSRALL